MGRRRPTGTTARDPQRLGGVRYMRAGNSQLNFALQLGTLLSCGGKSDSMFGPFALQLLLCLRQPRLQHRDSLRNDKRGADRAQRV